MKLPLSAKRKKIEHKISFNSDTVEAVDVILQRRLLSSWDRRRVAARS